MSVKDIFCQNRGIRSLQRAFGAGKLAHAYIFAGPEGVGRFKTASEWAKVLLCHNRVNEETGGEAFYDSCGNCPSCKLFEAGTHPDFKHVYKELREFTKDGKGKPPPVDMPIDVIREFLLEKVSSRPAASDSTVYVVNEAEKLNPSSQNALLKVLEEPPGHCFIILLCTRLEKLLPTTQSRCQIVRFGQIDHDRIVNVLVEKGLGSDEAAYWAALSEGSIGTAIKWASLELEGQSCYEIKKELIERLVSHKLSDSVEFAEWICSASKKIAQALLAVESTVSKTDINRRAQKGLLRMMIAAINDAMKINIDSRIGMINADQAGQIEIIAGRIDAEKCAEKITKTYENIRWIDASVNEKLIFEELLLNYANSAIMSGLM